MVVVSIVLEWVAIFLLPLWQRGCPAVSALLSPVFQQPPVQASHWSIVISTLISVGIKNGAPALRRGQSPSPSSVWTLTVQGNELWLLQTPQWCLCSWGRSWSQLWAQALELLTDLTVFHEDPPRMNWITILGSYNSPVWGPGIHQVWCIKLLPGLFSTYWSFLTAPVCHNHGNHKEEQGKVAVSGLVKVLIMPEVWQPWGIPFRHCLLGVPVPIGSLNFLRLQLWLHTRFYSSSSPSQLPT